MSDKSKIIPKKSPRLAAMAAPKSPALEPAKEKKSKKSKSDSTLVDEMMDILSDKESVREAEKKAKKEKKERRAREKEAAANGETNGKAEKAEKKDKKKRKAEEDIADDNEVPTKKQKDSDEIVIRRVGTNDVKEDNGTFKPHETDANLVSAFKVSKQNVDILKKKGITHLFPIQSETFDVIYAGKDVVGRARTGTGKTLAFTLPICEKLMNADREKGGRLAYGRKPRAIVLAPTRELAQQVCKEFELVGSQLVSTCVYGGAPYGPMEAALHRGVDVVVGTCGRVKDLLEKGTLKLTEVRHMILDEVDEMLSMGFAEDVELILSNVPKDKESQTVLFSATMPAWVDSVSKKFLRKEKIYIDLVGDKDVKVSNNVQHYAIACHWTERNSVLADIIQVYGGPKARTIIFTETKKEANELSMSIKDTTGVLHGDIPQAQRESTLRGFREGKFNILIATDVAARGIDIPGVELVVQCEPPESSETYVHRSGRTGRAGAKGVAVTFYTPKQLYWINQIERQAKLKFIRAGVPQKSDLISSSSDKVIKEINAVHKDVLPHFMPLAKELIDAHGAETVLARCLAKIAGFTEPIKSRSLLMSATGFVTVWINFSTGEPIRSLSFVWNLIRKYLFTGNEDADNLVKGMRLTEDKMGAVFDVPSEYEERVKTAKISDRRVTMTVPKTLPAIQQPESMVRPESARSRWARGGGRQSGGFGGGSRGRGGGGRGGGRFSR